VRRIIDFLSKRDSLQYRRLQSVKKVAERHFFELFSSGACAYGAVSTECKERKPLGFHPF